MDDKRKVRTYGDDVPEGIKEVLSREWGERKRETYAAGEKHGMNLQEGESFNKVVTFDLQPGFYHFNTWMVSKSDISPEKGDIGELCGDLINSMAAAERRAGCTPLVASNVCDWDSGYAKEVGANTHLRDSIINACVKNDIVLTGGETANLGDQVRRTGMGWMFTLLSRYESNGKRGEISSTNDNFMKETFNNIADKDKFEIVNKDGIYLLHVKKGGRFILTADGTGSKSIVCDMINKRTDSYDTFAMTCDDATRDGAFPVIEVIGVHHSGDGISQIMDNAKEASKRHSIPILGSVFHSSSGDIDYYIMNGVAFSEVRPESEKTGKKIQAGTPLVVLYEKQRSNGITTQRNVLGETFGARWYEVTVEDAFKTLNKKLNGAYSKISFNEPKKTLGELVAHPSTPYFRADSMMPDELLDSIQFRINVSSGGIVGKTERLLRPFNLGAEYKNLFDCPDLIKIIQMASYLPNPKGVMPDMQAYSTWGCGNGAVIGTTDPSRVALYYNKSGIEAKGNAGIVIMTPEIVISSRCLDAAEKNYKAEPIVHHYQ
jgi:phosphoribosylaminoimidazole (AIR) synthetase